MNSQRVRFELGGSRGDLENSFSDEQAMALERTYNDLYEDDSITFMQDISAQLYYRTADIYVKKLSDLVNSGGKVLIACPQNENLVVLSEKEYNELEKAWRSVEFLAMVDKSA